MKTPASFRALAIVALVAMLSACSSLPKWSMPQWTGFKSAPVAAAVPASGNEPLAQIKERPELLMAATDDNTLITFNAATPDRLVHQFPLQGMLEGELIAGMDFDTHRPTLYALSTLGRVLRIDPDSGKVQDAGAMLKIAMVGKWTMDVDAKGQSLRLVSQEGICWRIQLDPKTGQASTARLASNLTYAPGDLLQKINPRVVALAHSHATSSEPGLALAIDGATAYLVQQGHALTATADDVLADEHQLNAIGPLGIDRFDSAAMDIAEGNNAAYVVTTRDGVSLAKLYELNLSSGQARLIGAVGTSKHVQALTIVP